MNQPPESGDILRWYPKKWSEIAGNTKVIQAWWNFIVNGLCNALFTGPSRSGKTRTITLGIRAMLCTNRTADLNPCGQCLTCKAMDQERYCHTGLFATMIESEYDFKAIDCERVSREELLGLPQELDLENPRTIVYLDEVTALGRRGLEPLLLKPIDESRVIWLASAIKVKRIVTKEKGRKRDDPNVLSLPMQGRFGVKVGTMFPSDAELTQWIKDRCKDWQIIIEAEEISVPLMIEITGRRVGYVIHVLAAAAARGRRIDPDWLVEFNIGPQD